MAGEARVAAPFEPSPAKASAKNLGKVSRMNFSFSPSRGLDEQVGADVEEGGEFFGLGFADGALAVEDLGGDSFRSEKLPEVFLCQVACFHQMLQRVLWAGFADGIATLFVFVN
jgi:hypothetical protein